MIILFKNPILLLRNKKGIYETKNVKYLVIQNDIILSYGDKKPEHVDEEYDMSEKLIMPGLVNAHGHTAMTLLRGVGTGLKLQDWLNEMFPIEDKITPEEALVANRLACIEMIKSGTTTFEDMYMFPYTTMKAAIEAGLNANIARCVVFDNPNQNVKENIRYRDMLDFINILKKPSNPKLKSDLGLIELDDQSKEAIRNKQIIPEFNLHSEYLTNKSFLKQIAKDMKKGDVFSTHISETELEHNECIKRNGLTPIEYFIKNKVFTQNNAYVAHCVYSTEKDFSLMAKHGVSMVFNPSSNMKLGNGFAPIKAAINKGVNVALGTDGCASNNNLNMLEELHLAALLASGSTKDPTAISINQLIDMATINGAKALGRKNTGTIKVGYKADLIAFDLNKPNMLPNYNIPSLIVYSASSNEICMTMANGRILYKDGKLKTLDEKRVIKDIKKVSLKYKK